MEAAKYVSELVEKARVAQAVIENYTQEQVDALCKAMAKAIFDNAEPLARMAVDETGMGVYEDKVNKNKGKARVIWSDMKGGKSVGIIRQLPELGLTEVAKPMGVVGAITPTTNPIVTPMCNAMFALKGRNAIIVGPHPRSKKCSTRACELMQEAIVKLGAPADLLQCDRRHGHGQIRVFQRQARLWRGRRQRPVHHRRRRGPGEGRSHDRCRTQVR